MNVKAKPAKKKTTKKSFKEGIIYLNANWNNIIVTLTDVDGNVLGWSSPGKNGFKGSRQSTPYAGQVSAEKVSEIALGMGMESVEVVVRGIGVARDQAIRGIIGMGLSIRSLVFDSRLPHGGCRTKKIRKV